MARRRRFPLDALALPYVCADPACTCRAAREDDGAALEVEARRYVAGWEVLVSDDRGYIDVYVARTLNEALEALHREFPMAHFDPEAQ